MNTKMTRWSTTALLACGLAVLTAAGCSQKTKEQMWGKSENKPRETQQTQQAQQTNKTRTEDGRIHASAAFPTGDQATSGLLIEKSAPQSVQLNSPFQYTITATNLTNVTLEDVVVTEQIPENLEVTGSAPRATKSGQTLTWELGQLDANASQTITLEARATGMADLTYCAAGTYNLLACATTLVTQPDLALSKSVNTNRTLICDPLTYTFTVRNDGNGPATNVVVRDPLPRGLTTTEGDDEVTFEVGTLAAGEERTFTTQVDAQTTGEFNNTAVATADGGLRSEADAAVTVVQPELEIEKSGPEQSFIDRDVTYTIEVTNTGDGEARETVLRDNLPNNATFVRASDNGTASEGTVTWNLGTLAPDASRQVTVTVKPTAQGRVTNRVTASAHCAEAVNAAASTNVTGIAALLLEVVDQNDPVRVGQNEVYTITVTNQGSAADTNIQVTATMEDEMAYVGAVGPTNAEVEGNTITFNRLAELAAGEEASWRVTIRATDTAEQRVQLRVEMNSDEMPRSVMETEATNFYE